MPTYYNPSDSEELSFTVQGTEPECTSGQTKCENNISYQCSIDGSWVVGGSACTTPPCTAGATKCLNGYYWTCDDGVWTLTNIPCQASKNYMPYLILGGFAVLAVAGVVLLTRRPRD